jgi:hypothetical protein
MTLGQGTSTSKDRVCLFMPGSAVPREPADDCLLRLSEETVSADGLLEFIPAMLWSR